MQQTLHNNNLTEKVFSVKQTNIAKGLACILLLTHHLFYSPTSYDKFTSVLTVGDVPAESIFAVMCKVCVAIFLFLSGYGVNETMSKRVSSNPEKKFFTSIRCSLRLLWKLWAGYIFIFILFVPWQGLIGRHPYNASTDLVIDIFGLSHLFHTPTMNATWWYMSIAIFSYLISPLYKFILNKYKALAVMMALGSFVMYLFLGGVFLSYIFLFGMIASEINIFGHISKYKRGSIYNLIVSFSFVVMTAILRYIVPSWAEILFAFAILVCSFLYISKIKIVAPTLEYIGKHSANIFMFHTFLYLYVLPDVVYAPKYAPLIVIIFTLECILVSIVIEFIKKITFAQKGFSYIESLIGGKK